MPAPLPFITDTATPSQTEATKRGLGAALLRKPSKLARLVAGIAAGSPLPLTVKIRTGENEKKINVEEVVALLQGAGAAAVTVHGRTMEQRWVGRCRRAGCVSPIMFHVLHARRACPLLACVCVCNVSLRE